MAQIIAGDCDRRLWQRERSELYVRSLSSIECGVRYCGYQAAPIPALFGALV